MAGLTEQQKKALNLGSHVSVTANAGSGKTRVLTERYVEAVKTGIDVERILCLTFTEKAALELKERIQARINSEIFSENRSAQHDGVIIALRNARSKMLEANISTIHSFCSQVLKEFPVEAGIDANFKVLEDFDSATMKEESCDRAIRGALADEREHHGDVHHLLVRLGYRRTLDILVNLLDSREKVEHIKLRGHRLLLDEETVRAHWKFFAEQAIRIARENVKLKEGDLAAEINEVETSLNVKGYVLPSLTNLIQRILTKEGTPRKRGIAVVDAHGYSAEAALAVLGNIHDSLAEIPQDRKSAPGYFVILQTMVGLLGLSVEHYDRKKYTMGALDFDDLQIKTMHLLTENENVRKSLALRFAHIMVDEFQDTNFLQYDIFLNLAGGFSTETRLFVVGDPKQSIYRFRNAQVEVSEQAERQISGLKNGTVVPLLESFRMNTRLAAFVNRMFSKVMSGEDAAELNGLLSSARTEYQPLVPIRPEGIEPAVEIFVSRSSVDGDGDDDSVRRSATEFTTSDQQASFIASRIAEMADGNETIRDARSNELPRRIKYGDIAILLRNRSRLEVLENALNKRSVPYSVTSGIGFYSAQEIFDLRNYLTFLLDTNADISLLTVLRSPFFGISEDELFQTSLCKGENLFEKFQEFSGSEEAPDEVKYAVSVLNDEIQLAHRFTIPQLVNRILERTGWLGAYRQSTTGEQRIANMRKLLSIAREFEGRGFNSLYDFVERLKYLKETAREGQAALEEAANAVKIMTVHAAKGMEYPVVFVPFCDATTKRRNSLMVNDHVGILPIITNETPPELSIYQKLEKQNEQAEIARLFYVACTRAMDRLILTTAPKKHSARSVNSFTDIISRSFDISSVPGSGFYEFEGGKVRAIDNIPAAEAAYSPGLSNMETDDPARRTSKRRIFLDPIPADIDGEIYSATLLQTYRLCPTKYFLRYRLGMPAPELAAGVPHAGNALDEYDDSVLSTVKGSIVHTVLHDIMAQGIREQSEIVKTAERIVGGQIGKSLDGDETERLLNQVVENSMNAMATLLGLTRPGSLHLEETIMRRFGTDYLTGTLDLFIEDEEGIHIFDYKTNRLERGMEKIYSDYEIQMKFYALLGSRLRMGQSNFDVTIIFTREPGKHLTKIYTRKEILDFENELESMIHEIRSIGSPHGSYPKAGEGGLPISTPHCGECEYFVGDKERKCLLKE